jgi:signal transduction histidine kinase
VKTNYRINNLITFFFVIAAVVLISITIVGVLLLNQREIEVIRENNLERTHDTIAHIIAPSVSLFDGSTVVRQLSLASDKNQFFVVINNADVLAPNADESQIARDYFGEKIKNLTCHYRHATYHQINGINYWVKCSDIVTSDINQSKNTVGVLVSFSKNVLMPTFSLGMYSLGFSVLMIVLIGLFFRNFLNKYLIKPLVQISSYIQCNKQGEIKLKVVSNLPLEIQVIKEKFEQLLIDLNAENNKRVEYEKREALLALAAQVAHDMRSPLLAVDKFFHLIEKKLDESERVFGKRAMRRLDDIAWSLLSRYKNKEDINNTKGYVFLYSSLLELVAEKRMEYSKHYIEFDLKIDPEDAFSLAYVHPVPLKRMFSNLINNAVNAILPNTGLIEITLKRHVTGIIVAIKDSGRGMSIEKVKEILTHARSEKEKTNLGLPHAMNFLQKIDGQLCMESGEGKGTTVTITLPSCPEPDWCFYEYQAKPNDFIIIIDDNQSVHDVWDEAFKKIEPVNFFYQHLYQPEEALRFFGEYTNDKPLIIFCDYEFFDSPDNGLDLLNKAPEKAIKVLVTSHLYDPNIMKTAIESNVKLLPKDLLPYFKLSKKSLSGNDFGKIQLIFIDNEKRNTESWEFFADIKKHKIVTYNDIDNFLKEVAVFDKSVPVYIDLDLGRDKNGIDYAKEISEAGFSEVYIATGAIDFDLKKADYPWIKDVIEKKFPLH